ncbi:SGNH/GDSL hydrolase family protein [Streptomyces syringium]|uniref:SGNH/GDSL hydrolase family protein n=1 Tax=Streptomyces syringium TaxID=76729 RepID=UPI003D8C9A33
MRLRHALLSAALGTALSTTAVVTSAQPGSAAAPPRYVALGDSVAAGIGAGSLGKGEDDCWINKEQGIRVPNAARAYPRRVAAALGAKLDFKAFCGANTRQVIAEQLGTLNKRTKLVTVQVGANNYGFTGVVMRCILASGGSVCHDDIAKVQQDFATKLDRDLGKVYRLIQQKAGNARVLVIGYPKVVRQTGTPCYGDGLMARASRQRLNGAAHTLNDVTRIAAGKHDFEFVEAEQAFKGHAICDKPEWINGLSLPTVESFHPNALGHQAYGWLIWQKVRP